MDAAIPHRNRRIFQIIAVGISFSVVRVTTLQINDRRKPVVVNVLQPFLVYTLNSVHRPSIALFVGVTGWVL